MCLALLARSAGAQQGPAPAEGTAKFEIKHPGFARHFIALEHEFESFYVTDLDGNGLGDLVVIESERLSRSRDLFVSAFLQGNGGFKRAAPPQPLPGSVSLAGAGQFAGAPGLALLTPDSVVIWPWGSGRFQPEREYSLAVQSVFPVRAGEIVQDMSWLEDLNEDGSDELIVPRFEGIAVLGISAGRIGELGRMAVRPRTRFWRTLTYNAVTHDVPTLFYRDLDGNGWKDVIAFNDDQLWVYPLGLDQAHGEAAGQSSGGAAPEVTPWLIQDLAPPKPFDPKVPYDPPMRLVRADDLNGDGALDLVLSKNAPTDSDFNAKSLTQLYFGRKGNGARLDAFPDKPDQVYPSEGFSLPIVLDYNNNGKLDLIQVNVEVSFWNAMRAVVTRTVKAEAAYYFMGAEGRYPAAPDELEGYAVGFSLNRFGHQPIAAWGDFNGDGLPDLLLSSAKDALGIHWGRPGAVWNSKDNATIQDWFPIHQRRVHVIDLNGDKKSDIVLTFVRDDNRAMPDTLKRLTVLISQHVNR
jgi:hypothetical protein